MFDLAIIGGGPGGYVAAERAGAAGLSVVLFEKKELGGVCLNEGCIPTKTLLYSAKVYETASAGVKYGVTAGEVSIDVAKVFDRKARVVRRLVGGVGMKMKAHNVHVVKGAATIKGRTADGFEIGCGEEVFQAAKLLICTGSEAFVPPVPGLSVEDGVVMTNREILVYNGRPGSLVVIGGGVIGMEFASFYNSLGTQVTVVEMLPEILGGIDAEISAMLRDVYTKKGVKFNLSCKVTRVEGGEVFFTAADGTEQSVTGEKILVSVGRRAVTTGFGLENLGVELDRGAVKVDDKMRTNVEGVFAAGDVTGFSMFAHTASREAEVVVNNLTGGDDRMTYDAIPGVVYTNPEVASVGLTAAAAAAKGIECREVKLPMAFAGRFVAENEMGVGLCKVVVDSDQKVIGLHMIGNPSSEIVFGGCMAIEQRMTVAQLEKVIFPHPTVSEIFRETIFTL